MAHLEKAVRQEEFLLLSFYVLLRLFSERVRSTHIREDSLLDSVY